jgi:hypothetical protein
LGLVGGVDGGHIHWEFHENVTPFLPHIPEKEHPLTGCSFVLQILSYFLETYD